MGETFFTGSGHIIRSKGGGEFAFDRHPDKKMTWGQVQDLVKREHLGKIEESSASRWNREFTEMMSQTDLNRPQE